MVATNKLRGRIVECGYTQKQVAERLGIAYVTFYHKMRIGIFNSDEIYKMIEMLDISNPVDIFFAHDVTCDATKAVV